MNNQVHPIFQETLNTIQYGVTTPILSSIQDFHRQLLTHPQVREYTNDCITTNHPMSVEDFFSWREVQNDLAVKDMEEANKDYEDIEMFPGTMDALDKLTIR